MVERLVQNIFFVVVVVVIVVDAEFCVAGICKLLLAICGQPATAPVLENSQQSCRF